MNFLNPRVALAALVLTGVILATGASSAAPPIAAVSAPSTSTSTGHTHGGAGGPGGAALSPPLSLTGSHSTKPAPTPPWLTRLGPPAPQVAGTELAASAAHLNLVLFGLMPIAANGALSFNVGGWHSVGGQRDLTNYVLFALVHDNVAYLNQAMDAMAYTFANQSADGSWPQVAISGSPYPPGGGFTGTIFFYASLGKSLGLMQDSPWFMTSAATAPQRGRLAALAPKIARGLAWLSGPANSQQLQLMGKGALRDTNRAAAAAEGFLLVGHWLNNAADTAIGERLLLQVESNQLPDGTILEAGGFDAGYQKVSIDHLYDIYFHLTGSLASFRAGVWNELAKGIAKENTVVEPSGEINFNGSTRVACGGETYHGEPKQGAGRDLSRVEEYTAVVTGKSSYLDIAARVINYYLTHTHSHCV